MTEHVSRWPALGQEPTAFLSDPQQRLTALQPLAEALARAVLLSVCTPPYAPLATAEAIAVLQREIAAGDPVQPHETDEDRHGREMAAMEAAALMIGLAFGRRLGDLS